MVSPFYLVDFTSPRKPKIDRFATYAEARAVALNPSPAARVFMDGGKELFFPLCNPQELHVVREWVERNTPPAV